MVKIVDKRVRSEEGEYGISFASRNTNVANPHAFVIWYYSDPQGRRTVRRGAGFYPTADASMYELVIGANGRVVDDSRQQIAKEIVVLVNRDVFDRAVNVESQYRNETYRLGRNDCVTFVSKVAVAVPGLKVPDRLPNLMPATFIGSLHDEN